LINQASAQKSAPATEWTGRAVLEDRISSRLEHSSYRPRVFRLEISCEAIDEQEGFLARLLGGRCAINIAAPGWQFALRAQPGDLFGNHRQARDRVAQVEQWGEPACDRGEARQIGSDFFPRQDAVSGMPLVKELDFHPC